MSPTFLNFTRIFLRFPVFLSFPFPGFSFFPADACLRAFNSGIPIASQQVISYLLGHIYLEPAIPAWELQAGFFGAGRPRARSKKKLASRDPSEEHRAGKKSPILSLLLVLLRDFELLLLSYS